LITPAPGGAAAEGGVAVSVAASRGCPANAAKKREVVSHLGTVLATPASNIAAGQAPSVLIIEPLVQLVNRAVAVLFKTASGNPGTLSDRILSRRPW
jgi:hypothetical protein